MRTPLVCPDCGTPISVDLDREGIQVEYDIDEWTRRCAHPDAGGPTMCPALHRRLRLLLEQERGARNGRLKFVCSAARSP
jgi:hypothetical protein